MNPDFLSDMFYFVAVARARSFSRAGLALNIAGSTLSRHVARLERTTGLRLFNRTTRRLSLTEAGIAYLQIAEDLLASAEVAHETLQKGNEMPQGLLRISMPESLVEIVAKPWLTEFVHRYPDIQIELNTSPSTVDPTGDNIDIALRDELSKDSRLIIRRLATLRRSLFASPAYLERFGVPTCPDDLRHHSCICSGPPRTQLMWRMSNGREQRAIPVSGQIKMDSLILALMFAIDGLGIASAVTKTVGDELASGSLVRVLPDWEHEPLVYSALVTSRLMPLRTRLFLDFLADKMREFEGTAG